MNGTKEFTSETEAIDYLTHRFTDDGPTQIRAELTAGRSIADLVPEAVGRHIIKHGLYGAVDGLHGDTQVT